MKSLIDDVLPLDFAAVSTVFAPPFIVENDSRCVDKGMVFVACRGEYHDGRDFIADAIARGAAGVLWDDDGEFEWNEAWQVPNLGVRDLSKNVGQLAAWALGNASAGNLQDFSPKKLLGITGTNGKTSLTHWLAQAWTLLGQRAAVIGTVGNGLWGALEMSTHTTPDPVRLQRLLADFRAQQISAVAMEVSSHGLDQNRVFGVPFQTAVLTNLTHDHLDYHGSMAAYAASKRKLFYWESLRVAILNIDDDFGASLAKELKAARPTLRVWTYGLARGDFCLAQASFSLDGMKLKIATPVGYFHVESALIGHFNAANLLAACAVLFAEGVSLPTIADVLRQVQPSSGRMQKLGSGDPWVIVDYAHTPDALEKVLLTVRSCMQKGAHLRLVFGCGGNRDREKRAKMGEIAAKLADFVLVTNDNPRFEAPEAIAADILSGMGAASYVLELDRRAAIGAAIAGAGVGDVVVIAGKGHETYQDIQGERHDFSDVLVAQDALVARQAATI